jgi:hypothetical protein
VERDRDLSTVVIPRPDVSPSAPASSNLPIIISAALVGAILACAGILGWLYFNGAIVKPQTTTAVLNTQSVPAAPAAPAATAIATNAEPKTKILDEMSKSRLLGLHRFSNQWISWNYFGQANVYEADGTLNIVGRQDSKESDDYVFINGVVTEIGTNYFTFKGEIITKASSINSGKECKRVGDMTFQITGQRKYWRLKEMLNPCTGIETEYIDIYF